MARPKNKQTEIIINDDYKIVRQDALNWATFKRTDSNAWTPTGNYFGQIEHALEWLARKTFNDSGEIHESLEDAVKAIKASNKKFAREVAKAIETM